MAQDKSFLGTGWSFPPQFNKTAKGVIMVSGQDDIGQSLRILLDTSPGERTMQPGYGCGLRDLVFDNITSSTIAELKDTIDRAILFFEPRITLNSVTIDSSEQYDGVLKINLEYTVRATNSRSNMVYPFYIKEGTQVKL
jgi:phage baseplate assembly protein W